ncbi:hypothetical protein CcCBS67573_g10092 [Chytriomyces confervae]|uniref:ER membrane protein complex subunit 10 n=1 Tax=Chytriomyces confervae TaxID=246404 RepID=A0A507DFW6_9FUNG|nr:hypothetical protein CcCBS67573_g10092 [Chytriomyces confervae]
MKQSLLGLLLLALAHCIAAAAPKKLEFNILHAIDEANFTMRGRIVPVEKKAGLFKYESDPKMDLTPFQTPATDYTQRYKIIAMDMDGTVLTTSIQLCQLQKAKFNDFIAIHLDQNGTAFHIDYTVDSSSPCSKDQKPVDPKTTFKTRTLVSKAEEGARPKLEQMSSEKAEGKEVEKSFLQKYWYYIVPLFLILVLTGGDDKK